MTYSNNDYAGAMLALLPSGRIWDKGEGSPMANTVEALVPTFQRLSARAEYLLVDAFPPTTTELIDEWEATCGLPDPCLGASPTLDARRGEIVARLTALTGPNIPSITAYARALGYYISIKEFAPFYADVGTADTGLYQMDAAYLWQVQAPNQDGVQYFLADRGQVGDTLGDYASTALQCEITRLAPAHTNVVFSFDNVPDIGDFIIGVSAIS